ncbi:MAG: lysophospholipid acyltransferase family protein [Candidatus Methylomirabilis sp.]|nr:lysophospholipid acyltransferase family protein [Deltaproteobacteria bacterium]
MLLLLKALSFLLGHMPYRTVFLLGGALGSIAFRVLKKHRNIALGNLDRAFGPALGQAEKMRIARNVFRNLSIMLLEFTRLPWLSRGKMDKLVQWTGLENMERALARGKGVIILTAHFGNWELLGACLGLRGYRPEIVVRELDNSLFERFVTWVRTRSGNRIVYKKGAMRKLMKGLARNSAVAILVDQNVTRSEGFFVDFFGVPACSNKGPALLALASGAPVVPVFIRRRGPGHLIEVQKEVEVASTGDREKDAAVNTARFARVVEEMVRRHPEEWFWVHNRWKTRPAPGDAVEGSEEGLAGKPAS